MCRTQTANMAREIYHPISNVVITLCGFVLIFIVDCSSGVTSDFPLDFRITLFKDLESVRGASVYSHPHISHYSQVAVDIPHRQLIVGARNHLVRLGVEELSELELASWAPSNTSISRCMDKGQSRAWCNNFVRVLMIQNERVFTCGTNAFAPNCTWRPVTNLNHVEKSENGVGKCPYSPADNATALLTRQGELYAATVTDFSGRDPAIYRLTGPGKMLRTVQYNSRWLNEPDFISTYEIDDFVYFFFRETAVEYINCGKSIFSRVARICKSDQGGKFLLEDNWTTFTKARLNCSLPGTYPFYFNEMQGTYYDSSAGIVYAVFTTNPTSIYGSAVCAYNMTAFNAAFDGPYKYQENAQMAWTKVANSLGNMQCPATEKLQKRSENDTPAQRMLVDAQKFQMMNEAIQPLTQAPLIVAQNERFSHIAVDTVRGKHHSKLEVIFVVSLEGVLKKMARIPGEEKTCLLEEIHLTEDDKPEAVTSLELVSELRMLVITMNTRVIRLPVERCSQLATKQVCLNSQDPYCGWDGQSKQCTASPTEFPAHHWHQRITGCPILEYSVDGGWSSWSEWGPCDSAGDECLCRQRRCDSPAPAHGGVECDGRTVQVTNCTVHGGWTAWSSWSACTASCGVAVRSRRRACGNPAPRHGGRVCVGSDVDEEYCHGNPQCPVWTPPPVDGGWSAWSTWSICTSQCGGGVQTRSRLCDKPAPRDGGQRCHGNDQDWKLCNIMSCSGIKKSSKWTPWVRTNVTRDGYIEERYRFVCRANVQDERHIRISDKRTMSRICPPAGCQSGDSPPEHAVDGGWGSWSSWSQCDEDCGGGTQHRERQCDSPEPEGIEGKECPGHGRELQTCNTHSCTASWSCWSSWSSCSTSCGAGRATRTRVCENPAGANGHRRRNGYYTGCLGPVQEEQSCGADNPCPYRGWTDWTVWSECSPQNLQQRKRDCHLEFPLDDQCVGTRLETRMCEFNVINTVPEKMSDSGVASDDPGMVAASSSHRAGGDIAVYHLVLTALLGFALGAVVSVGVFVYCQRWRRAREAEQEKYATLTKHQEVKQNHYISPSELDLHIPVNSSSLNSKYYSTGSLKKGGGGSFRGVADPYTNLTVKEATMKRESLLNNGGYHTGSLMRTNLSLHANDF